jgi:hypothetical protein
VTVRIIGATLRDLSYCAANMRPEDRAEIDAQHSGWTPTGLAALHLRDHAYCALIDGNPEAAFGAGRIFDHLFIAWSFMTRRGWRAVPRMTAFVREAMFPAILEAGAQRVEARALASNVSARRWLKKLGATEDCELENYGRNGESFILYSWTRSRFNGGDDLFL